eukprot:6430873-Pyramimonas_sp.AAC.1
MPPLSKGSGAAAIFSGSSSVRSRSVRSGPVGCQGGLDPRRYIEHNRFMARRSLARRSTAQPSAQCIEIDAVSIAIARRPIRCL